jgi:hypothetical protein
MEFQRRSCLTEVLNSCLTFGKRYILHWEGSWILAQRIILRPMDKLKGLIIYWKTCWELVPCNIVYARTRACHMRSSRTTIVIRRVSRWHLSRLCMDGSVEPRPFMNLGLQGARPNAKRAIWEAHFFVYLILLGCG